MSSDSSSQEEDLLESALSSSFTPVDVPRVVAQPPSAPTAPAAEPVVDEPTAAEATPTIGGVEQEWRMEYESHVEEWRARSAEQRQKSEATRAHWEKVREEEVLAGGSKVHDSPPGVPSSTASTSGWVRAEAEGRTSPSPADARDLVTGEVSRAKPSGEPSSTLSSPPVTVSNEAGHNNDSEPEYIPSELTSSYPSINFPSDTNSPSSGQRKGLPNLPHEEAHPHPNRPEPPKTSATSAVFDTTLSTRTRLLALTSSLAINLLLPFVNGVMLGFGELFAKNVVLGWFGWKNPGATAANVGVRRQAAPRKREL